MIGREINTHLTEIRVCFCLSWRWREKWMPVSKSGETEPGFFRYKLRVLSVWEELWKNKLTKLNLTSCFMCWDLNTIFVKVLDQYWDSKWWVLKAVGCLRLCPEYDLICKSDIYFFLSFFFTPGCQKCVWLWEKPWRWRHRWTIWTASWRSSA